MNSIRKWLYRPKKSDQSLLAQFFYADEDLNTVTSELDSFDGRKDPDRCTALVNHLRQCQDKVLNICQMIMDEVIPDDRAPRDFRAKFPDDVLQENLAGQLWFGAECLAAGSSILNRELESTTMRPLAKAFTKSLENVRNMLREQCFRNPPEFTEKICESLKILDRLFAEFELSYVSAMVPVKTVCEYEAQQSVTILFSETLQRALGLGLLCQDEVDSCDPSVMFTIPRLAIVAGLLIFPEGPLCLDCGELCEMFRPFRSLLLKIRELLWTLTPTELSALERALCSSEEPSTTVVELEGGEYDSYGYETETTSTIPYEKKKHNHHVSSNILYKGSREESGNLIVNGDGHYIRDYLDQFCKDFPQCRELISDLCNGQNYETTPESSGVTSESILNGLGDEESNEILLPRHQLIRNAVAVANHTNNSLRASYHGLVTEYEAGVNDESVGGVSTTSCSSSHSSLDENERTNNLEVCEYNDSVLNVHRDNTENSSTGMTEEGIHSELLKKSEMLDSSSQQPSSSSSRDSGLCSMTENYKQGQSSSPSKQDSYSSLQEDSFGAGASSTFDFPISIVGQDCYVDVGSITPGMSSTQQLVPTTSTNLTHQSSQLNSSNTQINKKFLHVSPVKNIPTTAHNRYPHHHHYQQNYSSIKHEHRPSTVDENVCETSSFDSDCQDDIEIALAMQAAEIATRTEARSRFKNSADLIHRLFICISGVADQLQTNYAADLRSTLKCVFAMNATPSDDEIEEDANLATQRDQDTTPEPSLDEELHDSEISEQGYHVESSQSTETISPPSWVPDELAPQCMSCLATFTVVRRRHHCRACGKVFCGKCSGNSVPLPRLGYGIKPQRVCNSCFVYRVTPFTLPSSAQHVN